MLMVKQTTKIEIEQIKILNAKRWEAGITGNNREAGITGNNRTAVRLPRGDQGELLENSDEEGEDVYIQIGLAEDQREKRNSL